MNSVCMRRSTKIKEDESILSFFIAVHSYIFLDDSLLFGHFVSPQICNALFWRACQEGEWNFFICNSSSASFPFCRWYKEILFCSVHLFLLFLLRAVLWLFLLFFFICYFHCTRYHHFYMYMYVCYQVPCYNNIWNMLGNFLFTVSRLAVNDSCFILKSNGFFCSIFVFALLTVDCTSSMLHTGTHVTSGTK